MATSKLDKDPAIGHASVTGNPVVSSGQTTALPSHSRPTDKVLTCLSGTRPAVCTRRPPIPVRRDWATTSGSRSLLVTRWLVAAPSYRSS